MKPFMAGGWFIYLLHIILLAAFIAASAIDLKLWVIPLSICWFVTAVGLIGSAAGIYIIHPPLIRYVFGVNIYSLLPSASADGGSLAVGAAIGLAISLVFLATGLIKRSYETDNASASQNEPRTTPAPSGVEGNDEPQINHRLEICREIIFLLPIIICSLAAYWLSQKSPSIRTWWLNFSQQPVIAGLLGSLWGYFVGCGVVWFARILGTLGFGKEAMGLGDVHLMGAAGAVIGSPFVVVAFFIAPFFGLAWAGLRTFFKKTRQIPYGPFLSLGIFTVMILHDKILDYLNAIFYY